MSNTNNTDVLDRAHEWVSLNHPDLDGEAYDRAVAEAAAELVLLDKASDAADAGLRADGSRK